MSIDELLKMQPTLSEYASQRMMEEIIAKEEWRYYGSSLDNDSRQLAERFLKYHAKLPGVISDEVYARQPAAVFYWSQDNNHVKGGLFVNGAVTISYFPGKKPLASLFIDDASAQRLGYPEEGYVYLDQVEGEDA